MKYICTDGVGADLEIEADSPREAAAEYVDGGEWGDRSETIWIDIRVTPLDDDGEEIDDEAENITVTLDPDEPDCLDGDGDTDHDWQSPHEVVGGLEENPGVYGHGGVAIITEVCARCGCYRVTDTWAQRPDNGVQGLESVEYKPADE